MDTLKPAPSIHPHYATLKTHCLALQADVEHSRHQASDGSWIVLSRPGQDSHYRCRPPVFEWLQGVDGRHTLDELLARLPSPAEQATGLELLHTLFMAGFLTASAPPSAANRGWDRALALPLMLRLGVHLPPRITRGLQSVAQRVVQRWILLLWGLLVCWGVYFAASHQAELLAHWHSRFLDPASLLLLYLAYPLLKAVHELAHALALLRWNGRLGQVGFLLLFLVPLPFVDASAAHHFTRRSQRIAVGSAGVVAELACAAIGLLIWSQSTEGAWRDLGFNLAFIGVASSLLFNGNPLMRFDGYYVLSDLLNVQNLNSRSFRYLGGLCRRYFWRLDVPTPVAHSLYERLVLGSYGGAALAYRCAIYYWICLYLLNQFFAVGVVLASLATWLLFVRPISRGAQAIYTDARRQQRRPQTALRAALILGLALWLIFGYRGTLSWALEGTVKLPPSAQLQVLESGFALSPLPAQGTRFEPEQVLLSLSAPPLLSQQAIIASELRELQREYQQALSADRSAAAIWAGRIEQKTQELTALTARVDNLQLRAPAAGVFIPLDLVNQQGRYLEQGQLLGYLLEPDLRPTVLVAVRQLAAEIANSAALEAQIRFVAEPDRVYTTQRVRRISAATHQLADPAFGSHQGGDVPVDIRGENPRAKERVFYLELQLDTPYSWRYLPRLAHVKLQLPGMTLFEKWAIFWRDRLLTDFSWL